MKRALIISLVCSLFSASAYAAPTLLTISESENGQTQSWWPNQAGLDKMWTDAFEKQGVSLIVPSKMSQAPKLSPTVYGQKKLSDANARTMASLFGADSVLNGDVVWTCRDVDNGTECHATAILNLLHHKSETLALKEEVQAIGPDAVSAKKYAISRLATDWSLVLTRYSEPRQAIPEYIDKPVILFSPLPDADSLVALRKQLKRVPGIEDVAERWVSDAVLAVEINPGKPVNQAEFQSFVQGFMRETTENLIIRQTSQNERGASFEVVKY